MVLLVVSLSAVLPHSFPYILTKNFILSDFIVTIIASYSFVLIIKFYNDKYLRLKRRYRKLFFLSKPILQVVSGMAVGNAGQGREKG